MASPEDVEAGILVTLAKEIRGCCCCIWILTILVDNDLFGTVLMVVAIGGRALGRLSRRCK